VTGLSTDRGDVSQFVLSSAREEVCGGNTEPGVSGESLEGGRRSEGGVRPCMHKLLSCI